MRPSISLTAKYSLNKDNKRKETKHMEFKFDVNEIRAQFPACSQEIDGTPIAYLDGPAGTQVPQRVIDRIVKFYTEQNANKGGNFKAGRLINGYEDEAREAVADFLGCSQEEVGFSCSTTQNNFNLSRILTRHLSKGDEIITTEMDHRANYAPWIRLGQEGFPVKIVKMNPKTQQIDMHDYKSKLSPNTKIVALNWASNALGTVTDVKTMIAMAHEVGAITIVDAVHYSAHFPVDVKDIDTDILLCSSYKWFGPHMGVIYMKQHLIEELDFYNVMVDEIAAGPRRFHMGTPQYELLVGITEAINFISSIGEKYTDFFKDKIDNLTGRRRNIVAGMLAIDHYEQSLALKLRTELRKIPGITVYGPCEGQPRTPTVVFTVEGKHTSDVTKMLGAKGINSWDGDYYAVETIDALGLRESGGLVRFGIAPYNTSNDIDRALTAIRNFVGNCTS